MYSIPKRSNNPVRKTPKPGVYRAIVTDVCSPEGFVPNRVVDIYYTLFEPQSYAKIPYTERFIIVEPIPDRTVKFEEHLYNIGIMTYEDYIGCYVELKLLKDVKNSRIFLNVYDRKLISRNAPQNVMEGGEGYTSGDK